MQGPQQPNNLAHQGAPKRIVSLQFAQHHGRQELGSVMLLQSSWHPQRNLLQQTIKLSRFSLQTLVPQKLKKIYTLAGLLLDFF
jgi:hypothetical protein